MEKIKGKFKFRYDKLSDVLYCSINKPRPCATIEPKSGIVIRYDPDINKVAGFTILDYKRRLRDGKLKSIPYFEDISLPDF